MYEEKLESKKDDKILKVKQEDDSEHEGTFENKEDKMSGRSDINIPVFDGEDYSMWKKRITMYLKFKKCDEVMKREKATTDKEEWDEKDLKAVNYMYSAIPNKQLEFVCEEGTTYKIMKKKGIDRKKLNYEIIVIQNHFSVNLKKTVNELKSAGAKMSEKEKLKYMLNTLPESYSYIGDLIDTLKEEDQTADYVRNKIKLAEMKNQGEYSEKKDKRIYGKEERRNMLQMWKA